MAHQRLWPTLEEPATSCVEFSKAQVADLPEPVQRYFLHAIAPHTPLVDAAELTMQGEFKLGRTWQPMTATETLSAQGFTWKAHIGKGLWQFLGSDSYHHHQGHVHFALWGLLPVANTYDADTKRSAIGRLVSELIWLPSALLPQSGVRWQAIDDHTIQVRVKVEEVEPVTLTLTIDAAGRLKSLTFPRWGNQTPDHNYTYIPFGSRILAEKRFGGYTIPCDLSAGWWFGCDRYCEFFRAKLEGVAFSAVH